MTAKLGKVEIYTKGPTSTKSFARPMAMKPDKVMDSNAELLSTESHNMLITWSHKVI